MSGRNHERSHARGDELMAIQITAPRFLRIPEVFDRVGFSRPNIYRWVAACESPKQIAINANSVVWWSATSASGSKTKSKMLKTPKTTKLSYTIHFTVPTIAVSTVSDPPGLNRSQILALISKWTPLISMTVIALH